MRNQLKRLVLAFAILGMTACGGARDVRVPGEAGEPSVQKGSEEQDEEMEKLRQQLATAIEQAIDTGEENWLLNTWCRTESGPLSFEVYGNGIGVWDNRAQFRIDRSELDSALRTLLDSDFPGMRESYGGKNDPLVPPSDFATLVICQVDLKVHGFTKTTAQLEGGRQFEPFRKMAEELLHLGAVKGESGVTAESLTDALTKVSRNEMAAEIVRLVVNRQPEPAAVANGATGWRIHLEGTRLTRVEIPQRPGAPQMERGPDPETVRRLAGLLVSQEIEELPSNLYADLYTDIFVEVFGFRKAIQARRFARMDHNTHGVLQQRFDEILAGLEVLQRQIQESAKGR